MPVEEYTRPTTNPVRDDLWSQVKRGVYIQNESSGSRTKYYATVPKSAGGYYKIGIWSDDPTVTSDQCKNAIIDRIVQHIKDGNFIISEIRCPHGGQI